MKTILRGLGTATPPLYATQEEAYAFFTSHFTLAPAEQDLYRRILLDGKIKGRYLGMDATTDALETDPDRLLARFLKFGRATAVVAARRALAEAGVETAEIVGLVVNTCTGYLCPGLSSYVAADLGLRTSIRYQDLVGMGCGAAVPNLEAAAGMLARSGEGPVLSLAVEICTATIFPSHEPELIVSNSIFGDGAAAAVLDLAPDDHPGGLARLVDFATGLFPQYREDLGYRTDGGRLRNHLSKRVPVIGAHTATEVASRLLARHGLSRNDIAWWAVHPGGTVVLAQVAKELELPDDALRFSYHVFENYGNMSSPSVLFVLREILDRGRPQPGQKGMLLAFGAGFSAFAALMEFAAD
ncbi:MAG: 3-oxoacyl-ACP synthase [Lentisphaerae bacterium RIFOXYB12_FULL_65_16]|nr:MAG: 3-oxoacyl-ACP synthase [Lentisphaerae bacterium RIFOXYA12_64_32]OGV85614.1 MAG: 3-oxoacyl-ACP synthase [Lentisphaerae bacterium RIFOXYB12_FULL_65_16]